MELKLKMQGASVTFAGVSKRFGTVSALEDFSLDIRPGEFVTLLGASGSGKSTVLNILAGFADPTSGDVRIGDRSIIGTAPEGRNIGMVFQNFSLFPHMSVAENVAFPLKMRKVPKAEIEARVMAALKLVRLDSFAQRKPAALSGGQRQRVALARAVVFEPPVLLMDECLSALDLKLREELQIEIRRIHDKIGATTVFVTHDQGEALTMSDRVAVLNRGRIEQIDQPLALYDRPATRHVAEFIGQSNLLETDPMQGGVRVPGIDAVFQAPRGKQLLALRPERIARAERLSAEDRIVFDARLEQAVFHGANVEHRFRLSDGAILMQRETRSGADIALRPGENVALAFRRKDARLLADD